MCRQPVTARPGGPWPEPERGVGQSRGLMQNGGMQRALWIVGFIALFAARAGVAQDVRGGGEVSVAAGAPSIPAGAHRALQTGLPARMEAFLRAVGKGDVDSIGSFFPRRGDWTYQRTTHTGAGRQVGRRTFGAKDVQRAIQSGPLASSFSINVEGQPVGSLSHQLGHRRGRWQQLPGARFVPPGGTNASDIFVAWRMEGGIWVVSTLADEAFGGGAKLPPWCC